MTNRYRIFDNNIEEKCYVEEPDYRWMLTRNGKLYNSENDEYHTIGERYIVEFSTGLFDANNTEIFENDKFKEDDEDGNGYYLVEYDNELSKFCVNLYSHNMYHNENGGEEYDNEISLVDKNVFDVADLKDCLIWK